MKYTHFFSYSMNSREEQQAIQRVVGRFSHSPLNFLVGVRISLAGKKVRCSILLIILVFHVSFDPDI